MKTASMIGLITIVISIGAHLQASAQDESIGTFNHKPILLAQTTIVTRDAAINTATKVKKGNVLKATLEK